MASSKKSDANKRNAKLSKGPIDTSKTRFNALKHGILSKEAFIIAGDWQEDGEEFNPGPGSAIHGLAIQQPATVTDLTSNYAVDDGSRITGSSGPPSLGVSLSSSTLDLNQLVLFVNPGSAIRRS